MGKPAAAASLTESSATFKPLDGRAEHVLWAPGGYLMAFGWIADEGSAAPPSFSLHRHGAAIQTSMQAYLRHMRRDVAELHGTMPHDFGYLFVAKVPNGQAAAPITLRLVSNDRACEIEMEPTRASDERILEEALAFLGSFQAHAGREVALTRFVADGGQAIVADLNLRGQRQAAHIQQIERFGPQRRGPSFMTVLFGSVEAAMFQPLLFAEAGAAFGEWIYTCNSPELADELMRLARTAANLYDLPIRVVVLSGNAGFGGANNAAIPLAASGDIVLVNPDVHPLADWSALLNRAIEPDRFASTLRGGLLFYDEEMLMHGGMYLDEDVFFARGARAGEPCRLLRVEHHDKGVPFLAQEWPARRPVRAVTGALMAFQRAAFESIGGFSSDFVYGHYEDADLCLRWADRIGPVEVDPDIRLVHLEGQGSKTRAPHFHGAAIVNRHIFDARARPLIEAAKAAAGRPA